METIYAEGSPIASFLEGGSLASCMLRHVDLRTDWQHAGNGALDPDQAAHTDHTSLNDDQQRPISFAPPNTILKRTQRYLAPLRTGRAPSKSLSRIHDRWSTAINSRLGHTENARFLEHFRYILVASQLLNEYLDQGALPPSDNASSTGLDGASQESGLVYVATSPAGVVAVGVTAFALAALLNWTRTSGLISWSRAALVLTVYLVLAVLGYVYCRRQWLKYLRRHAVDAATGLTAAWQTFEVSSISAISLIQEVELVSKGYRLSTPLPPISRMEDSGASRRCARLRKVLHKAYTSVMPACNDAVELLKTHANEEDLERFYEIYDINTQDVADDIDPDAPALEHDAESLKSLRVLSFRAGVLRRIVLCHLMSLHADGGKPDIQRWQRATQIMLTLKETMAMAANSIAQALHEMETLAVPMTPANKTSHSHTPTREKMRSQVRKISALSTGIRGLQAKMQILREETNKSIEQSEDLTDLGPDLVVQYDSIGADIKELMQAWEQGKASLHSSLTKQERHISLTSSGLRSPVSSLGGLTAVDEDGTPADALRALNGEGGRDTSARSSLVTSSSEDEIFEAVALPKQRSSLTREERISKMYEERDRQAALRAKRDANTSMLKELESVINLRPKKPLDGSRVTSM